jgi:phosphoribosylformimino-5-aminoimidazole carboxamide ribotide isomerase
MGSKERPFGVVPAVDVLGDGAVRLVRGDYDEVAIREPDPLAVIRRLAEAGVELVHVVDLTAARSGKVRPELFRRAVEAAGPMGVQAAGGIRTVADAEDVVAAGATRIVVGTAAFTVDGLLDALVAALGERLVVAVDVRDGLVAIRGWEQETAFTVERAIERCASAGVARLLCTAIERDGTLAGPALDLLGDVVRRSRLPVVAAGGIRSLDDVDAVAAVGCEAVVVGRAWLEGRVPLTAFASTSSDP